jgi:hypothetical protein
MLSPVALLWCTAKSYFGGLDDSPFSQAGLPSLNFLKHLFVLKELEEGKVNSVLSLLVHALSNA